VGAISDRSRLRWGATLPLAFLTVGRRRPFMVAGSGIVGICLLTIGWTREIGSWFLDVDEDSYQTVVIWIAVISVYLLDFAINAGTYFSPSKIINHQYKPLVEQSLWILSRRRNKRSEMHGLVEWWPAAI